ncbi:MAG: TetR/AcrR family transcriptional regulator [Pseudomonadota bacterium]
MSDSSTGSASPAPALARTAGKPLPKQARAAATRAAILDAAEDLLSDHFPAALTTRLVADRAGVPIGSVYRYFDNMDDLLRALFDRMNAGTVDVLSEPEASWPERLDAGFAQLRALHATHPAYVPLMAHLKRENRETDEVALLLADLIRRDGPHLDDMTARDITRTVVSMLEGVEARLVGLSEARRNATLEQSRIAVHAYLSHHLGTPSE